MDSSPRVAQESTLSTQIPPVPSLVFKSRPVTSRCPALLTSTSLQLHMDVAPSPLALSSRTCTTQFEMQAEGGSTPMTISVKTTGSESERLVLSGTGTSTATTLSLTLLARTTRTSSTMLAGVNVRNKKFPHSNLHRSGKRTTRIVSQPLSAQAQHRILLMLCFRLQPSPEHLPTPRARLRALCLPPTLLPRPPQRPL